MTQDLIAQAWRTALDPAGDWMPQVLRAADARLQVLRAGGMPDAGGLVIASDQQTARAYAKLLERITGEKAVVVLSDDAGRLRAGSPRSPRPTQRWLVAVRMVSEGVDIPRLAVGVYATSASTPLYFAQAIGRFVRARRPGETASVFLPSVPHLLGLASEMEAAARPRARRAQGRRTASTTSCWSGRSGPRRPAASWTKRFEALSATAELDQVIFDGATFGTAGAGRHARGGGVPGPARPAHRRPGGGAADQAPGRPAGRRRRRRAADRAGCRPAQREAAPAA